EETVLSATYGLEEIKSEVSVIEETVLSPIYGLFEIKAEVIDIINDIQSPIFGLYEVKTEVAAIEEAVLSATYGLEEIKYEVSNIENILTTTDDLTTGPFFISQLSQEPASLIIKVLNNTNIDRSVTVRVYEYGNNNPRNTLIPQGGIIMPIIIKANQCFDIEYSITRSDNTNNQCEVQFFDAVSGIYCWAAIRTEAVDTVLNTVTPIPENTYRHAELVPLITDFPV
ncbi:hypothetical protein, partial [Vallitalea sediminicola]